MSKPSKFAQPFPDYEILERLGSGGMGTVFRARRKTDDAIVAVKVLRPSLSRNARYVDRLRREAEITMRLNHPGIVKGYGLGEEGGYHYLVMEFVPGRSLKTLLKMWGRFPEEQVLDLGIQLAVALADAHEHGVVHRDIKPGNVLVDEDDRAKLTDLGLAKGDSDPTLTRDGATVGTPQYMSPEQAQDPSKADERSDLYSLGATLYHMAVGLPPFEGDSVVQVISKLLNERADSAGSLNPEVSTGVNLILRRLLAKNPDLRYQTAEELLTDLRRVQAGQAPSVDIKALARDEGRVPSQPRVSRLAAVLLAVAAIAAVVWIARSLQPDSPAITKLAKLKEAVGKGTSVRTKLELIDAFTPAAEERKEHRALRQKTVRNLETDLLALQAKLDQLAFVEWLDGRGLVDWQNGWFEGRVRGDLYRQVDYQPKSLPEEVRELWLSWVGRQRAACTLKVKERCGRIVTGLERTYETTVRKEVDELCRTKQFGAAITLLERAKKDPQTALAVSNGGANNDRLPVAETKRLASLRETIERTKGVVRTKAAQCVGDWEADMHAGVAGVRRRIDRGEVETAARALDALEDKATASPPWHTLPEGVAPRRFGVVLADLGQQLATKREAVERRALEHCQDQVHRELAQTLDVAKAKRQHLAPTFVSPAIVRQRDAVRRELTSLQAALKWIAETAYEHGKGGFTDWVLEGKLLRAKAYGVQPGSPPSIVLRPKDARGERAVPLAAFARKQLVDRVLGSVRTSAQRTGLGLFLFYGDHFDEAYSLLGTSWVQRLDARRERRRSVLATRGEDDESQAARVLDRLRSLLPTVRRNFSLLERHLTELVDGALGRTKLVQGATAELTSIRRAVARERRRRGMVAQLEESLRADGELDLSEGDDGASLISLSLPLQRAGTFRNGIGGWRRVMRGLVAPPAVGDSPRDELESPLRLRLPVLDAKRPLKAVIAFSIPADGRPLDLLQVELAGGRVLLAQAPGGAGRIGVDVKQDRGLAIKRALTSKGQPGPNWFLIAGATHELRIEVGPVHGAVRGITVLLDGIVITAKDARIKWRKAATLAVGAVGGMVLHSIRIEGEGRE